MGKDVDLTCHEQGIDEVINAVIAKLEGIALDDDDASDSVSLSVSEASSISSISLVSSPSNASDLDSMSVSAASSENRENHSESPQSTTHPTAPLTKMQQHRLKLQNEEGKLDFNAVTSATVTPLKKAMQAVETAKIVGERYSPEERQAFHKRGLFTSVQLRNNPGGQGSEPKKRKLDTP